MDNLNWIIGLLTVVFAIVGIANNNKKKREEQGLPPDNGSRSGSGTSGAGMGRGTKPVVGGSLGRILEELSRQMNDQPSPTIASKPLSRPFAQPAARPMAPPQPEATSHDYYSLENEYDMMDGREYRGDYNSEDSGAEQRYVGGEQRYTGEYFEPEVVAYERLAAQRAQRSSLASAKAAEGRLVAAGSMAVPVPPETTADNTCDDSRSKLQELLGSDFDLRRAVIESEILAPKYIS